MTPEEPTPTSLAPTVLNRESVIFPDGGPGEPAPLRDQEASDRYQALMNDEPYVPKSLRLALQTAHERRTAADRLLGAAEADVARKQAIETEHREQLEAADAAITGNDDLDAAWDLSDKRRVAEAKLVAARNMLRKSSDARSLAQAQLAAAKRHVEAAADAIISAEAKAITEQIEHHLAEATKLGTRLEAYAPDELNTPLNSPLRVTALPAQQVLDRLRLLRNDLNTPLNIINGTDSAHAVSYAQRRAEMIRGGQPA
jgi:hypothetical protein